jgi:hypothetical protein
MEGPGAKKRENLEKELYEDAERRRKDLQRAKEIIERERDLPKVKPYHNEKSEKYVQKRFVRDLRLVQETIVLGAPLKRENEEEEKEAAKKEIADVMLNV